MGRKKVVKEVVEAPVVFFLRNVPYDEILPAGADAGYSEITYPAPDTTYQELLRGMEPVTPMSNDMLRPILEKVEHTEYGPDTACFWCCHTFSWTPCVLPISYDTLKQVYLAEGHFCSPECALAFLYKEPGSDSTRWNRHTLLRTMVSGLYTDRDLTPAPPRSLLRMFGGPLDIAQYRGYLTTNDIVASELPPIRLVTPVMNIQGPVRDIKRQVALSAEQVEKASDHLRLRRSKPVQSATPTLDTLLRKM
jgi:hypothetical protein